MRRVPPSCQGNHHWFVFLTTRGRVSPVLRLFCWTASGTPASVGLLTDRPDFPCSFLACAALVNISKRTENVAPQRHPQTYHSLCEHADVMSSFLNRFFELFIVIYYFYN